MGLTMKKILDRYEDSDMFSVTYKYMYRITKEEISNGSEQIPEKVVSNALEKIPEELKESYLNYEISKTNVFASGIPDGELFLFPVTYYFELNDESKKYLLKFKNEFCLSDEVGLEDLTLYKNNEVKFYSVTHEGINSLE